MRFERNASTRRERSRACWQHLNGVRACSLENQYATWLNVFLVLHFIFDLTVFKWEGSLVLPDFIVIIILSHCCWLSLFIDYFQSFLLFRSLSQVFIEERWREQWLRRSKWTTLRARKKYSMKTKVTSSLIYIYFYDLNVFYMKKHRVIAIYQINIINIKTQPSSQDSSAFPKPTMANSVDASLNAGQSNSWSFDETFFVSFLFLCFLSW